MELKANELYELETSSTSLQSAKNLGMQYLLKYISVFHELFNTKNFLYLKATLTFFIRILYFFIYFTN